MFKWLSNLTGVKPEPEVVYVPVEKAQVDNPAPNAVLLPGLAQSLLTIKQDLQAESVYATDWHDGGIYVSIKLKFEKDVDSINVITQKVVKYFGLDHMGYTSEVEGYSTSLYITLLSKGIRLKIERYSRW